MRSDIDEEYNVSSRSTIKKYPINMFGIKVNIPDYTLITSHARTCFDIILLIIIINEDDNSYLVRGF